MIKLKFYVLLALRVLQFDAVDPDAPKESARHFQVPMHEILQNQLYLSFSEHAEIKVAYADRNLDFKQNDYLTNADGIRFLTGKTLQEFLKSGTITIVADYETINTFLQVNGK